MSKQYPTKGIVPLPPFVKLTNEHINNSVKTMHSYLMDCEWGHSIGLILILLFRLCAYN